MKTPKKSISTLVYCPNSPIPSIQNLEILKKTLIYKPRSFDSLVLDDKKMEIYNVHESFQEIYREYINLLSGKQDIDPDSFESDFLTKSINAVESLKKGQLQVF